MLPFLFLFLLDTFDLSDETGEVAHLWSHPEDNGKNFLTERGNFILVRVERKYSLFLRKRAREGTVLKGEGGDRLPVGKFLGVK